MFRFWHTAFATFLIQKAWKGVAPAARLLCGPYINQRIHKMPVTSSKCLKQGLTFLFLVKIKKKKGYENESSKTKFMAENTFNI